MCCGVFLTRVKIVLSELVAAYKNQQKSSAPAPKQTADQTVVTKTSTPTNLTDPAPSVLPISLNSFGNAFFDSSLPSTTSLAPPPVPVPKIKPVEEMTGSELDSTVVSMTVAQINRLWSHINYYKEKAEKLLLENGRLKVRKGERGGGGGGFMERVSDSNKRNVSRRTQRWEKKW